jgi:hypothetical protein
MDVEKVGCKVVNWIELAHHSRLAVLNFDVLLHVSLLINMFEYVIYLLCCLMEFFYITMNHAQE